MSKPTRRANALRRKRLRRAEYASCILALTFLLLLAGCNGVHKPSSASGRMSTVHDLLEPLHLGMTRAAFEQSFDDFKSMLVLTHPAQSSEGAEVALKGGSEALIAFDEHGKVFAIQSDDKRLRCADGLSVGDTYAKVLKFRGEALKRIPWPGYGWLVEVEPQVWLVFPYNHDGLPAGNDKAQCVELRSDL